MKNFIILLFASFALFAAHAQDAKPRPNIVVFLVDDMGLMDTSVPFLTDKQGKPEKFPLNKWYRTPSMENLAKNGIRFSNFYAQSVCSPTRASIMSGQNATRHHTTTWINPESNNRGKFGPPDWNWKGLTKNTVTLAEVLREDGYRTIFVGKGHFGPNKSEGSEPLHLGFDVNIGGSSIGQPGSYLGDYGKGGNRAVPNLEKYYNTGTFLTEALTLEANKAVTEATQSDKPFFLYFSHYAVHAPFNADPRFINKYKEKSKNARSFATLIEGMDKSLGDLVSHLNELGVAENTLIFFLGDNGSDAPLGGKFDHASSAPLRGKKGTSYEGGMRVPFIAAWAKPNADSAVQKTWPIPHGVIREDCIGTVMDLFPTVLAATGTKNPGGHVIDGSNLQTLLSGKPDPDHDSAFLMHFPHDHNSSYFTSLRLGDWKLIYHYFDKNHYELYNLKNDPYENSNLAEKNPEQVKRLLTEMQKRLVAEDALYPVKDGKEFKPE